MKKLYLLLAVMSLNTVAYADENPYLPEPKLKDAKVSTWNVGAGFTKKLLHGNVEWVNPYGIAYAKAGVFLNDDNPAGGQVGFRYPYHLTGTDKNGYYIGAYAGHIESKQINGKEKARLGAGVDLAYVWLNPERKKIAKSSASDRLFAPCCNKRSRGRSCSGQCLIDRFIFV